MSDHNPYLACGACCMSYRVSFYWAEAEQRRLPAFLTEQVSPFLSCMAGMAWLATFAANSSLNGLFTRFLL